MFNFQLLSVSFLVLFMCRKGSFFLNYNFVLTFQVLHILSCAVASALWVFGLWEPSGLHKCHIIHILYLTYS